MLDIVYAGNDKMFKGLFLSILSILRRTQETIHFYLLSADLHEINSSYVPLSNKHIEHIDKLVKSFNKDNTFTVLDCTKYYHETFSNKDVEKWTPYSAFKLFIPRFQFKSNLVLYLDIDTLVNSNIKEVFDVDMTDTEICVCHLAEINDIFLKNVVFFNVGVILINISYIQKTNFFNKAIEYYKTHELRYNEESAMNFTCSKIKFWQNDERFNYQLRGVQDNTIIKHFCGYISETLWVPIKPWDVSAVQKWLDIHNWDEDYEFYKQQMIQIGEKL